MKIYELSSTKGILFSPPCWRVRLTLELLGLDYESVPVTYTAIKKIDHGQFTTVPVLENESLIINDSFQIAKYINTTYAAREKLFPLEAVKAQAIFMQKIMDHIHILTSKAVLYDIFDELADEDKEYFRASREKRIGKKLEEIKSIKEDATADMLVSYSNLEQYVAQNDFFGGDKPNYADIIVLSHLQLPIQLGGIKVFDKLPELGKWTARCSQNFSSVSIWSQ